jgi:hypothetical protein
MSSVANIATSNSDEDIDSIEVKNSSIDPGQISKDSDRELRSEKTSTFSRLFTLFLLGMNSLLSYNLYVAANDTFVVFTQNKDFATVIARAHNIPKAFTALVLCFYKPTKAHIIIPVVILILTLILTCFPILFNSNLPPSQINTASIILIVMSGLFSSSLDSFSYSIASQMTKIASSTIATGNGFSGVVSVIIRIITKAAVAPDNYRASATSYFIVGLLFGVFTIIVLLIRYRDKEILAFVDSEKAES